LRIEGCGEGSRKKGNRNVNALVGFAGKNLAEGRSGGSGQRRSAVASNRFDDANLIWFAADDPGPKVKVDREAFQQFSRRIDRQLAELVARWAHTIVPQPPQRRIIAAEPNSSNPSAL